MPRIQKSRLDQRATGAAFVILLITLLFHRTPCVLSLKLLGLSNYALAIGKQASAQNRSQIWPPGLWKNVIGKMAGNNDKDYVSKPLKCPVDRRKRSLLRGREAGTLVV